MTSNDKSLFGSICYQMLQFQQIGVFHYSLYIKIRIEFISNDISSSDRVYKIFSEQTWVTLVTILLCDMNDSDL